MLRVALKGLLARKLRTALTGFAVVIGVAFVAGTFVFTDTIDTAFADLFERTQKGVDVSVEARKRVDDDFTLAPAIPPAALETLRAVPGVEAAEGAVEFEGASIVDREGEIVGGQSPTILTSLQSERFEPTTVVEGDRPEGPDELLLDRATAQDNGFAVGDEITVAGRREAGTYAITGLVTLGDVDNLGGTSLVVMDPAEAQRVAKLDGYTSLIAAADGGTEPAALKAAAADALGRGFVVRTGEEAADEQAADLSEALGFLRTGLLVFAGVALLVGGFLIFNTFTVTVAQRAREFALLRTLGASRAQILRSVLAETLVIGVVASLLGLLGGLALAPALRALLASFGLELPSTGLVVEPRTVIAALAVGLVATVVSGLVPARRATRVQPVEAMREAAPALPGLRRRRIVVAAAVEAVGVAVLLFGLLGDAGSGAAAASLLGLGAVLMMFGLALLAPLLVRPLASVVGRPLERVQGLPGRLARENATRVPQRTAVTASALMIGVALVVLVTIFAAGLRASVDGAIDDQVRAEVLVLHDNGFSPLPTEVEAALDGVPAVATASAVRFETGRVAGVDGNTAFTGVDPATVGEVLAFDWDCCEAQVRSEATLAGLTPEQAVIGSGWAEDHGIAVGDRLAVTTPAGEDVAYEVAGTFENGVGLTANVVVAEASMVDDWDSRQVAFVLAAGAPGADADAVKAQVAGALGAFPAADPLTAEEYKDQQGAMVDQLLGLVFALLSLSVIVALLGIVNTLALAVHERTRELGMLRAVGMSRRQVRSMIRSEAVITAAIGALLGLVLGVALAAAVSVPLAAEGFAFVLPWGTLAVVLVVAALAGVLAAIPPARRAARVDVLRAVTTE